MILTWLYTIYGIFEFMCFPGLLCVPGVEQNCSSAMDCTDQRSFMEVLHFSQELKGMLSYFEYI